MTSELFSVLDVLPYGVVITTRQGEENYRNQFAADLFSHIDVSLVTDEMRRLASVSYPESELVLPGPPERTIAIRLYSLGDCNALFLFEDVSEARRLDRVRSDFIANLSHELRTPVGAITILAEAINETNDSESHTRLGRRILKEALRLGDSIEGLLHLSWLESGQAQRFADVDVHKLFSLAVDSTVEIAKKHRVQIAIACPAGIKIEGDEKQLVSALINLIDNAVKYSDPGSQVAVKASELAADLVEMTVSDTGVGIPEEDIDRVFERFYRVDAARSRKTGGTGLGLSIVRHVVSNHKGMISVTSEPGVETTFKIVLPRTV